jgi:uncharacterized protein YceK
MRMLTVVLMMLLLAGCTDRTIDKAAEATEPKITP